MPLRLVLFSLRNLTRFRSYLTGSVVDLKRKVVCILDQVFPEYQSVFSYVFGKTSKEIIIQFPSPMDFEEITSETLAGLLARLSRQKNWQRKSGAAKRCCQALLLHRTVLHSSLKHF